MRPTTKDLAKHAGVSRATVDRVLNQRPGVRQKTIEAVHAAIDELGFVLNLSAANLAKSTIYRICFLLPKDGGEFLAEIEGQISELAEVLRTENVEITFKRILGRDPHQIVDVLADISSQKFDGVAIMSSESPQVRDATFRLVERGVHVVQLIFGQAKVRPFDFVGIDNYAAGATAARLLGGFCKATEGNVLVITETMTSLDSAERRLGFDSVLQEKFPGLRAHATLETRGNTERANLIVQNAYKNFKNILGVYVMSSEAAAPLQAVFSHSDPTKQVIVAHEQTQQNTEYLRDGSVDALITQNTGHVVRSAVRLLRAKCDGRKPIAAQEDIRIEILLKENLKPVSNQD